MTVFSTRQDILRKCSEDLGLPLGGTETLSDSFLAALIRHTAGGMCPCSQTSLKNTVVDNISYLLEKAEDIEERIENIIDGLIVSGDLLELSQVVTDDPSAKGTWLFIAPPSFVVRPNRSIFVFGLAKDSMDVLPSFLLPRISYEGYVRVLRLQDNEALSETLVNFGLLNIPHEGWIRSPREESALSFRDRMIYQLERQAPSGSIEELVIIDPDKSVRFYKGRWAAPKKETGIYVARRPQTYGSAIWGLVKLLEGVPQQFLDFPMKGMVGRGADIAWHLQMAIDHCNGTPQLYRKRPVDAGVCLDFFAPLPLWAERRLMVLGRSVGRNKSLFSYWISNNELKTEEEFLAKRLWLKCTDEF
jgi:hypothetical protein